MIRVSRHCFSAHRQVTKVCAVALLNMTLGAGCGLTSSQREAVEKFAESTGAVADTASQTFVQTRQDVIALRTRMLELGYSRIDLSDPKTDLDGPLDQEGLETRLRVSTALKEFAILLKAMLDDNSTESVRAACDSMLADLQRIDGAQLSKDQVGAIGELVSNIAGVLIDYKRKIAVTEVVESTWSSVEKVIALMSKDFDSANFYWVGFLGETRDQIKETLGAEISLAEVGDVRPLIGHGDKKLSLPDIALLRRDYAGLLVDAEASLRQIKGVSQVLERALKDLRAAHQELKYKIQSSDISTESIENLHSQTLEYLRLVRIIRGK